MFWIMQEPTFNPFSQDELILGIKSNEPKVLKWLYQSQYPKIEKYVAANNGDEDQGLMGSLAVLMKLGLFQLSGGVETDPIYQLGSPLFRDVRITLDPAFYPGKTFRIIAHNHGPDKPYIRQLIFNGQPLQRTYLRHSEIVQGGVLELQMSDQPNKALTE